MEPGAQFVITEKRDARYPKTNQHITIGHLPPRSEEVHPSGAVVGLVPGHATYTGRLHPDPNPQNRSTSQIIGSRSVPAFTGARTDVGFVPENHHPGEKNHQLPLFNTQWTPPKIDSMAATADSGHRIPALLGAAALESKARYGQLPVASDSLSKHSAPIVQHLVDKGIIESPHAVEGDEGMFADTSHVDVTNDLDRHWGNRAVYRATQGQIFQPLEGNSVRSSPYPYGNVGSQFLRHTLRGNPVRRAARAGKQTVLIAKDKLKEKS
jgi:hypothetical protein